MAIDQEKKSNRLLGNRRFTSADLTTAQEAFTEVLDINSNEIYTQTNAVPTSSLPFSGSSQNGNVYQSGSANILKYWFRHRLTKSNVGRDVWFFLYPTGSNSGVTPQLVQDGQQTNFISPKYSISALANANTEDSTPGYGIKVFKSTSTDSASLSGGDIVSANDYQFDYKTGVLQFNSSAVDPSNSQYVYMTVYQYVGTNLRTGLDIAGNVKISGSLTVSGQTLLDSYYTGSETLIVSGAMKIVDQQVGSAVASSSLFLENLGTILRLSIIGRVFSSQRFYDIFFKRYEPLVRGTDARTRGQIVGELLSDAFSSAIAQGTAQSIDQAVEEVKDQTSFLMENTMKPPSKTRRSSATPVPQVLPPINTAQAQPVLNQSIRQRAKENPAVAATLLGGLGSAGLL